MKRFFPASFGAPAAAREKQRDDDAGHLEQRHERGKITFRLHSAALHRLDRGEKGHDRDRSIVRGDGGGILDLETTEPAHQEKGGDRRDESEQESNDSGEEQFAERRHREG